MAQRIDTDPHGNYEERWGWRDPEVYAKDFKPKRGLTREVVEEISFMKSEPKWMRDFRLKAYDRFERRPMPAWGANLGDIDFQNIFYFMRATDKQGQNWDEVPESIRKTFDRLGIPEAEQKYLAGVSAQYECLRGSTHVWTTRGMRRIKELEPGDGVFSLDETSKKLVVSEVTGKRCSGEKEVFEISARGRVIGASANHPFLVLRDERKPGRQRRRFKARWVPVEELRPGDYVAVATDTPDFGSPQELILHDRAIDGVFPAETTADLCWWAGLYLGDGYLKRSGPYLSVEIAVNKADEGLIAEVKRIGGELFGLNFSLAADGLRLRALGTKALADFIEINGLGGNAHTKRVPDWIFGLPRSQRLAFIAGFVDAGGYERDHRSNHDVVITSANGGLLADIKELAALCGINSSRVVEFTNRHPFDHDRLMTGYRLFLSGRFDRLPCRSQRRAERLNRRRYHASFRTAKGTTFKAHTSEMLGFIRMESIKPVGVEPVYDIEVAGHHNFVAEGFVVHNSEVVYHKVKDDLSAKGVLFTDMDTAVRDHPEIVQKYFATVIPPNDNKLAALNSSVWSGGSFIYVPPGVQVDIPLQAYFRINAENVGQFERTLIIADEGAYVHYVEGCTAPVYSSDSLHSAVVELIAMPHARIRYTTIQNWAGNVYNLVTKRAVAHEEAVVEWVDGNLGCLAEGSRVTTKSGLKPIELLIPGEEVLSFDETAGELAWRRVLAKKYSGRQAVREVRSGVRKLRVTDNHPFFSYTYDPSRAKKLGRYSLAYVRADRLTKAIVPRTSLDRGHPYKLERPSESTSFSTKNQYAEELTVERARNGRLVVGDHTDDELMWLFGLFCGDGSIDGPEAAYGGRRWAKVTFATPVGDRARSRLVAVMAGLLPAVPPTERADGVALTWNSVELAELLEKNGFHTGARQKRVPAWVLDLPESQRLALVAGYLDADGCAPRGRRGFSIKSVNPELLRGVADVLTSLGISARFHVEHDGERPVQILGQQTVSRGAYRLDFDADARLGDHVSEGLRAAVAAQSAPKLMRRQLGRSSIVMAPSVELRKVTVTEPLETVPTWDIEVEGTGNFVAEGFIVHNSKVTMKYPAVVLKGRKAHGEVLSLAMAGRGQHQDTGAKMTHVAPETTSTIISKSISKDGGRTSYRGGIWIHPGAVKSKSNVRCDALLIDEDSVSDTYPYMDIREQDVTMGHEATVARIGDEQLFYLMSRGIPETEAAAMIVRGFIEPITKQLPMEYAVELNRLIELQMEGSVG